MGPDYDIGNSPILVTLPNGKRALFAGTKGADVLALDPDDNGAGAVPRQSRRDSRSASADAGAAAIVWGGAADQRQVYYGMGAAGLGAVQSARRQDGVGVHGPGCGRPRHRRRSARRRRRSPASCSRAAGDGRLFAVSAADGKQLWEFNTAQDFDTVEQGAGARRRDRHRGRGRSWTAWSTSASGLRDQQRRVRRQRAAGLRRGVARTTSPGTGSPASRRSSAGTISGRRFASASTRSRY